MTTKKSNNYKPCIPLDKAKAIIDSGVIAVKKAREIQDRLEQMGVDVSSLKASLDQSKSIKRLADRMLKDAVSNQQQEERKEE